MSDPRITRGPWRTNPTPYLLDSVEALRRGDPETITVHKGTSVGKSELFVQFVQRAAPAQEPAKRFTFWSWCWCLVRLIGFAALAAAMLAGLEVLAWLVGGA